MCKIFPYLIPQKQMKWRYEFLVQFKTEYTKLVTFIEVLIRVVINLIAFRYRHTVIHWISLNFSQSVTKKKCISATNKIYIKIKIKQYTNINTKRLYITVWDVLILCV